MTELQPGSRRIGRCLPELDGSRRTAARFTRGAISLSSSSHFPLMPYSNCKAGSVAARARKACDEAGTDRVDDTDEHDRDRAGCLLQRAYTRTASGHNDVRRERDQFRRIFAGIPTVKAVVNAHIAAVGPTQLLQRLYECTVAGLNSGSVSERPANMPMRRMRSGCCARAASGHAAAAPPSSVMNSRRFIIQSPRRRGRANQWAMSAQELLRSRD